MEARVADIRAGRAARAGLAAGASAALHRRAPAPRPRDLLQPMRFPVHVAGRGGQYTYHGPGQRVVYAMLDLTRAAARTCARFVSDLEEWTIRTLGPLQRDAAERRAGPGRRLGGASRQAGLPDGSRARTRSPPSACASATGCRSTASSINVEPDLSHYRGIVPCGIADAWRDLAGRSRPAGRPWPTSTSRWPETFDESVRARARQSRRKLRKALRAGHRDRPARHRPRRPGPSQGRAGRHRSSSPTARRPRRRSVPRPSRRVRLRTQPARPRRRPVVIAQSR
mgnify:CR=1 FL=1